jgi:hypothetical protein
MGLFSFLTGGGNQLVHEKNQAILEGPKDDVARLVALDRQIGKIMGEFNKRARIPAEVANGIEKLLKDAEPSFNRVTAKKPYSEDRVERFGSWIRDTENVTEVDVRWLEYEHVYTSPTGGRIEQRVAQIRVGK